MCLPSRVRIFQDVPDDRSIYDTSRRSIESANSKEYTNHQAPENRQEVNILPRR